MANEQWPLTAAATQILLETPSADAKRGAEPDKKATAKLALKELIFRGAYRIEITETRRRNEIKIFPQGHVEVPKPLQTFHGRVRKEAGEIKTVMRRAGQRHPKLLDSLEQQVRGELNKRKLIEPREERRFGVFKKQRWVRTPLGDSWADDAYGHVQALEALPERDETDPRAAAAAVAAAGAALVLVPESLGWVARLRATHGGYLDLDFDGLDFDAFGATDGLLGSVGDVDLGGVDAGVSAVDSALDSVSSSIDAGVSAGADAGGGGDFGGGGDGGGGGGDGGGGGG